MRNINIQLLGSLVAGIFTSVCCVLPLVLLMLGISGAWMSYLTIFEPYRPVFIIVSVALLLIAYKKIYTGESEDKCCNNENICLKLDRKKYYKVIFWIIAFVIFILILTPYIIPYAIGVLL